MAHYFNYINVLRAYLKDYWRLFVCTRFHCFIKTFLKHMILKQRRFKDKDIKYTLLHNNVEVQNKKKCKSCEKNPTVGVILMKLSVKLSKLVT